MRGTRQAEALASVLGSLPGFQSAQQIHAELGRRGERIGLATVYRHLQVLSEDGRVDTIREASGETLYRQCRSEAHHHHLICTGCGSVEETELCAAPPAQELKRRHGFVASSHQADVYGLCKRCAA